MYYYNNTICTIIGDAERREHVDVPPIMMIIIIAITITTMTIDYYCYDF